MKANVSHFLGNLIEAQLWAIHGSHSVQRWDVTTCMSLWELQTLGLPADKVVTSPSAKHAKLLHLNTLTPAIWSPKDNVNTISHSSDL